MLKTSTDSFGLTALCGICKQPKLEITRTTQKIEPILSCPQCDLVFNWPRFKCL